MSEDDSATVTELLKEHPKLVGMLFAVTIAISQAGAAAASTAGSVTAGP
jgi:hypothetical protein